MSDNAKRRGSQAHDPETGEIIDPAEYVTEEDQPDEGDLIDGRTWVKTITAKGIEAHPERAVTAGQPVICCRIAGEVRGTAEAPADATKPEGLQLIVLVGEFIADSYGADGTIKRYIGEWCGLPVGQNVILSRLSKLAEAGVERPVVAFDLEFAAIPTGKSLNPYKWGAKNLTPVPRNDAAYLSEAQLARRRAIAYGGSPPQLEAPKP